jgi:recombination protein RecT
MVTKAKESEKTETLPAQQNSSEIAKKSATPSERFSNMVMNEFSGKSGGLGLTPFQKRLIQNYFISIDIALKAAEEKRMKKKDADPLAVIWQNVNMEGLAIHVVACARIGFDPALPNHINMMPFKNNAMNKYDIVFIEGYRGNELKANKYGYEVPDDVVVEVVYSSDVFKVIKKDLNNKVESYVFEIKEPFNRGEIVGGFYYHRYDEKPYKNKLMFYNKAEIEKRKPKYASAEFWGGTKATWENGKKSGTEVVEGWYHEMVWKTVFRAAYNDIAIDSQKIDDAFMEFSEQEIPDENTQLKKDITDNNAKEPLSMDFQEAEVVKPEAQQESKATKQEAPKAEVSQPQMSF